MKTLGLVFLVAIALAAPATAGQVTFSGSTYASGVGGEFTFTVGGGLDISHYVTGTTSNISNSPSFQTFCLEENEYIQQGYTYNFGALSDSASLGGVVGPNPDPISIGTAWLYSQFATGALAGYTWSGSGRNTSAGELQNAIWWLEGEGGVKNSFVTAAEAALGKDDSTVKDNAGTNNFGVYVLNLQSVEGAGCAGGYPGPNCQSQLVYVPDGGTTVMLLGGALLGLGFLRRKFRA
jgi:VPDSG-CTERM motif